MLKDKSNFTIIFVSVGYDKKALIEEQGQRSSNIIKYRNKMTTGGMSDVKCFNEVTINTRRLETFSLFSLYSRYKHFLAAKKYTPHYTC